MRATAHHTLDIYGTQLHAAYTQRGWATLTRLNPDLTPHDELGLGGVDDSRDADTDQQHLWIWVAANRHHDTGELVDTLSHEATHAAMFILQRHHVDVEASTHEPLAYLVGWLAAWLLRNMPELADAEA